MKFFKLKKRFIFIKYKIRLFVYKINFLGIKKGKNLQVYGNVRILGKRDNIIIGNDCSFNEGVILSANEKIKIGNNVTISSYTVLHTGFLDMSQFPKKQHIYKPIIIGNYVWIASHCVISAGVKIGNNIIIGANSFVNKDLEDGWFYAGNPVKKIKRINK